jgi:hypothetical protein
MLRTFPGYPAIHFRQLATAFSMLHQPNERIELIAQRFELL